MSAAGAAIGLTGAARDGRSADEPLAILGGKPVRNSPFTSWPVIAENDERAWMEVLRKGRWCRLDGDYANQFEEAWARTLGAKHCLAVANGTSALITSLAALGDRARRRGDRAPLHVRRHDQRRLDAPRAAGLRGHRPRDVSDRRPQDRSGDHRADGLHHAGAPGRLGRRHGRDPGGRRQAQAAGRRRRLPGRTWPNGEAKKVSTLGDLGCFSFQASKNLNSGEGGAILTNNDELFEQCKSFQNNGRAPPTPASRYVRNGANLRMTEFQAALLLQQLTRLEEQSRRREQNAAYLTELLREVPGITPAKMYDGCTRNAYHLYMFRYDPDAVRGPAPVASSSRRCTPRESPPPAAISRSTRSRS